VGGGLEYALGYGWSVKGEFLYVDFGDWNTFTGCASVGPGCASGQPTNLNVNLKDYIWRRHELQVLVRLDQRAT
jgi:opacity protein-like surface antigen